MGLPREEQEELWHALAARLQGLNSEMDELWYDEAEDRLAAYDRGELKSCTLDELIAAWQNG